MRQPVPEHRGRVGGGGCGRPPSSGGVRCVPSAGRPSSPPGWRRPVAAAAAARACPAGRHAHAESQRRRCRPGRTSARVEGGRAGRRGANALARCPLPPRHAAATRPPPHEHPTTPRPPNHPTNQPPNQSPSQSNNQSHHRSRPALLLELDRRQHPLPLQLLGHHQILQSGRDLTFAAAAADSAAASAFAAAAANPPSAPPAGGQRLRVDRLQRAAGVRVLRADARPAPPAAAQAPGSPPPRHQGAPACWARLPAGHPVVGLRSANLSGRRKRSPDALQT